MLLLEFTNPSPWFDRLTMSGFPAYRHHV